MILTEIEAGHQVSQRSLARSLGIALGLTNLLLRRLITKGWVQVIRVRSNRLRYLLTPSGIAEKARMSRAYFQSSVRFYAEARDRIRASFGILTRQCSHDAPQNRILFFGTGEVAEIGYIFLQEAGLELVGVIDDHGKDRFFDVPVYPLAALSAERLNGLSFDRLVVMSFDETETIRVELDRIGFPPDKAFWI